MINLLVTQLKLCKEKSFGNLTPVVSHKCYNNADRIPILAFSDEMLNFSVRRLPEHSGFTTTTK